jgi:hypothetical protein
MAMDQATTHMATTMDICLLTMDLFEAAAMELSYLHTISHQGSTAEDRR